MSAGGPRDEGDAPRSDGASRSEVPTPRRRWWLVALAAAALVSSWNPIAAPFGLVVGLVTAILSVRALRRTPGRRRSPAVALGLSALAVVASAVILVLTAGSVGVDLGGDPVVKGRSTAELDQVLSEAAARTKERRARAVQELDAQRARPGAAAPNGAPAAVPKGRPEAVPTQRKDGP
jgi:hypothetical protein